jgi:hypothetical protein
MAPNQRHPSGPPMTPDNMRQQGVRGIAVYCLNPRCLHRARLDVDAYPDDRPVPWFGPRMVCTKCGIIGADARPNWLERSEQIDWRGRPVT